MSHVAHVNESWHIYCKGHIDMCNSCTYQGIGSYCNTLQHTAAHCSTLQHTATHCVTPAHIKESVEKHIDMCNSDIYHCNQHGICRYTYSRVTSHMWMSHGAYKKIGTLTCATTAHIQGSVDTHMQESGHTCKCVMELWGKRDRLMYRAAKMHKMH